MNKIQTDCWPTDHQKLLLKACLFQGDDALSSWNQWKQGCDVQNLDKGSLRLLPLLYKNLRSLNIEDPLINQFRAFYYQTWCHNRKILEDFSGILAFFTEHGIPTLLLKGAALILQCYQDPGLRPIADVDMLIPYDRAMQSLHLLSERGWKPISDVKWSSILSGISHSQATHLTHNNHLELDLHWHLLGDFIHTDAEKQFWQNAVPIDMNGMQTRILDPTDQLFHTFLHGHRWNSVPPVRWIADAVYIFRNTKMEIAWNRMIELTQRYHITLRIKSALNYLLTEFNMPVPELIIKKLNSCPVNKMEIHEYYSLINLPSKSVDLIGAIKKHYNRYKRLSINSHLSGRRLSFQKYLIDQWNVKYPFLLPFYIIYKFLKRIVLLGAGRGIDKIRTK